MKVFVILGAVAVTNALVVQKEADELWAEAADGVGAAGDYASDMPEGYFEKPAPKPDPKVLAALVQKEKEKARKQALDEVTQEKNAKLTEDMTIELYTFAKTLKPSAIHKALSIKQKLEDSGYPPAHFRVAAHNLWSRGFKHENVANYKYVQDKLQDLDVAEKNLNRNIDSKPQLDMFLKTAQDVKGSFLKRFGAEEWQP